MTVLSFVSDAEQSDMHAEILKKLLDLQQELESIADTGRESAQIVELDQSRVGRLSRMDALQAQAMSQASEQRRQVQLRLIAAAISRIESGSFGICQACDEDVSEKRLQFDPAARLCIDCASAAESESSG